MDIQLETKQVNGNVDKFFLFVNFNKMFVEEKYKNYSVYLTKYKPKQKKLTFQSA